MFYEPKQILLKNNTPAVLRSPTYSDAKAMNAYLKACSGETDFLLRYPEECTETEASEGDFLEQIKLSPNHLMIACLIDGEVVGNCSVMFNSMLKTRHRASVAIAIRKAYWGLGIGTALFTELIAAAKEKGILQLELDYVEGNERAAHLYQKMGFVPIGERPDSIRLQDGTLLKEIMMVKKL